MSIAQSVLPEFELEMANTRKVLALIPASHADWKPHDKSFSLSSLAMHLANFPNWGMMTVRQDELDLAGAAMTDGRAAFSTTETLLATYDADVSALREALATTSDDAMHAMWTLKHGGMTIFTLPRLAVLRTSVLNHMIHHRGQLTVYLRLLDVPLPDLFGPTADTKRG